MTDFDAFRKEIQIDRIEIQRTIAEGFERLYEKYDEHSESDTSKFEVINTKIATMDAKASTIGKAVWTLFVVVFTAAVGYGFAHL